MTYPTVIMTFALIVLIGLVTFLVPVFVGVFKQFGGELPHDHASSRSASSDFVKGYWYL